MVIHTSKEQKHALRTTDLRRLEDLAYRIRRNVLVQAAGKGHGYVGQGLGAADIFAAIYGSVLNWRPDDLKWEHRDRFLLSIGHYSIATYATLAEYGIYSQDDLKTYCDDGSLLDMSANEYAPGFEITGGALGHGLSLAVGMALGARYRNCDYRIINLLSDGELSEGSTWEAAMCATSFGLNHLIALVDVNNVVADGYASEVLKSEPIHDKWEAFGWHVQRVNGNDMRTLLGAFEQLTVVRDKPQVIICDTLMGKGVPFIETREKAHFVRIEPHEWELALQQLEESGNQ
jgi:transketolase